MDTLIFEARAEASGIVVPQIRYRWLDSRRDSPKGTIRQQRRCGKCGAVWMGYYGDECARCGGTQCHCGKCEVNHAAEELDKSMPASRA